MLQMEDTCFKSVSDIYLTISCRKGVGINTANYIHFVCPPTPTHSSRYTRAQQTGESHRHGECV